MKRHWIGRRFNVSVRVFETPLGLGFRLFVWRIDPERWIVNVDILTPIFDLQFGFHRTDAEMEL